MAQITERRRTQDEEHEEIKKMINEIKAMLIARQHLDSLVLDHGKKLDELENGNGKIGFKSVRDKVMAWEKTGSAIALLVAGDIIMRVIQLVSK
jgi:hypothetical protein